MKKIAALIIIISVVSFACINRKQTDTKTYKSNQSLLSTERDIRLFAIRYGKSTYSTRYIFEKPDIIKKIPFHWLFYVIKTTKRVILVDTGFIQQSFIELFNVEHIDPVSILSMCGFKPEDITDIIITHSHFDHIGGILSYPHAKVHMFQAEYDAFMRNPCIISVRTFLENHSALYLYDNVYHIGQYIRVEQIGGHTAGSSVVYIDLDGETIVLTGDEAYLDENIELEKPIGVYYDKESNIKYISYLKLQGYRFYTFHSPYIITDETPWIEILP
ncbi:MAG: MBL fold metallo-hydrolase [Spirochaetales bacterium]|nr:MBL fold metallo-hydrolase [Spirochaetales bacterium]